MQKNYNLQDYFLNQARKDKIPLTVFLMNGVQMKGQVRGFDSFVVIIESDGKQQMVYKHAISTIIPLRHVDMSSVSKQDEEE
jgi:host factor-I protein